MKKIQFIVILFLHVLLIGNLFSQDIPSPQGQGTFIEPTPKLGVIYDQMDNPGTGLITSQNFDAANDILDSFAADDFAYLDMTWVIESVDVIGAYYNGSGPATSVNVWFYSSDGFGGLPLDIIYTALNVIPSAGLADGSFSIPLPVPAVLNEGWYWLCVQANMDLSPGGQWGWTERTVQSWSESSWKNPGGGFGTSCTPSWGYRVTNCAVGSMPDNCFRLNGEVTPVELISFTAQTGDNGVALNWSTATETNNSGFEIQRMLQDGEYKAIAFIPGYGTTTETHNYIYIDENLNAGKYKYRLKQIDFDGSFEYSPEVEVEVTLLLEFSLEQNFPNPFNPSTVISYKLPVGGNVTLKVFDILGKELTTLVNQFKPAGKFDVEFNAEALPGGVYFYRIQANNFIETRKMVLMK